jgi:hypothetical protein
MIGTAAALRADGLAALAARALRISVCTLTILGTDSSDAASSWNPTVETTDLPAFLKADDLFVLAMKWFAVGFPIHHRIQTPTSRNRFKFPTQVSSYFSKAYRRPTVIPAGKHGNCYF